MPLEVSPPERPVAWSTLWHEERNEGTPIPDEGGDSFSFVIENEWEPRDVELTYHGVQPVFDEWGREVRAHIYRYEAMQLEVTSFEFTLAEVSVTARWVPRMLEFPFDEATGRYLGILDIPGQLRHLADHRWPTPFAASYMSDLMVPIAFQALAGDLSTPVAEWYGSSFLNRSDLRPLEGDCQPYEYEVTFAPWYEEWIGGGEEQEQSPEDEYHHLVCVQEDGAPLWVFSGNASDNLQLTRLGEPGPAPALQGTGLEPAVMQARPFDPVDMLLGLASPVLVPPTAYPGDWADQLRPIIQGVGTNLDYLRWQLDRPGIFVPDVYKGFPYSPTPFVVGVPLLAGNPLAFDMTSWVRLNDGSDMFWAFVDSRYGDVEDPDLHVSRQGFAFDDYGTTKTDVVAIGEVQAAWETVLPVNPRFLIFSSFGGSMMEAPPEFVAYLSQFMTTWSAFEHCYEDRDGGRYAHVSAQTGQMLTVGAQTSTADGCSSGADPQGSMAVAMGGSALRLPEQPGRPAVLAFPGSGSAFVLDPRVPLDGPALARALAARA